MSQFRHFCLILLLLSMSSNTWGLGFGTSDSGGGTGINGQVFEAYSVNIRELSAFKKYVIPWLNKVSEANERNKDFWVLDLKSWYIVPSELAPLDKKSLGVTFLKSKTDQIARQSLSEVWIDKNLFENKSKLSKGMAISATQSLELAQAKLLLHEIVMATYMLRFEKFSTICRLGKLDPDTNEESNQISCEQFEKLLGNSAKPQPVRKLNEVDNERIRFITNWIIHAPINEDTPNRFSQVIVEKKLIPQLFHDNAYTDTSLSHDIEKGKLTEMLLGTTITGFEFNHCYDLDHKKHFECQLDISQRTDYIDLTLKSKDKVLYTIPIRDHQRTLSESILFDGSSHYSLVLRSGGFETPNLGDKVYLLLFNFEEVNSLTEMNLRISDIFIKPMAITGISEENGECHAQPFNPIDLEDSSIHLSIYDSKQRDKSSSSSLIQQLPYPCIILN